jgi:hypothetical protein
MMPRRLILLTAIFAVTNGPAAFAQYDLPAPSPARPYIRRLPDIFSTSPPLPAPPEATTEAVTGDIVVEVTPAEPPPKIWEGSFQFGLAGTEGSSETFNTRFGANFKSDVPGSVLTMDLNYRRDSADGVTTADQLFLEGRHEWERDETPWSLFIHGSLELDQFKPFDYLVASDAGMSYRFVKSDTTKLKGRAGFGVSREIGGPDEKTIPEGLLGMNFERKINDWQNFKLSCNYFPSWEDFSMFRLIGRADWEFILSAAHNLSLKVGVVDRYNSTPNGGKANSLDYSTVILWKF